MFNSESKSIYYEQDSNFLKYIFWEQNLKFDIKLWLWEQLEKLPYDNLEKLVSIIEDYYESEEYNQKEEMGKYFIGTVFRVILNKCDEVFYFKKFLERGKNVNFEMGDLTLESIKKDGNKYKKFTTFKKKYLEII